MIAMMAESLSDWLRRGVGGDDEDLALEFFGEKFYAEREYLALVLEIQVEDGAGYAAALGDLLESRVLVALVDENVESLAQYLALAFVVLDRD